MGHGKPVSNPRHGEPFADTPGHLPEVAGDNARAMVRVTQRDLPVERMRESVGNPGLHPNFLRLHRIHTPGKTHQTFFRIMNIDSLKNYS